MRSLKDPDEGDIPPPRPPRPDEKAGNGFLHADNQTPVIEEEKIRHYSSSSKEDDEFELQGG